MRIDRPRRIAAPVVGPPPAVTAIPPARKAVSMDVRSDRGTMATMPASMMTRYGASHAR